MKDSTNGKKPMRAPRTQILDSNIKKPKGSDIDWSNPCGDKATHFVNCTESPNLLNFSYNRKKVGNVSKARPTMCISSTNEGKTQVKWVATVGWKP